MELPIAANDNGLFYTYVWRDANGTPFYVGKGRNKRANDVYGRSADFMEVYECGGCTVEIVDWFILESQALAFEIELIARFGRRDLGGTLVNKTDGGDGCPGHIKTPEAIAVWRSKNVGRKRSADVGARISAAKVGHAVSAETRAKISVALTKHFEDPNERERMRLIASSITEETRAKMRSSALDRHADPTPRMLESRRNAGTPHTDEAKASISASLTGVPKSAATVKAMRMAQRMKPPRVRYKGVSKSGAKWRSIIYLDGANVSLGTFAAPADAARAYDTAAIAAWGYGNCYLNLPVANDNAVALAA